MRQPKVTQNFNMLWVLRWAYEIRERGGDCIYFVTDIRKSEDVNSLVYSTIKRMTEKNSGLKKAFRLSLYHSTILVILTISGSVN